MNKLLSYFIPSLNKHLSDDCLANLFCGELPFQERWIARQHLVTCWQCRLRQEELEGSRADRFFDRYLQSRRIETLSEEPEMQFSQKLRLRIQSVPQEDKAFRLPKISLPELSPMNPALVACMVFSFAAVLSF